MSDAVPDASVYVRTFAGAEGSGTRALWFAVAPESCLCGNQREPTLSRTGARPMICRTALTLLVCTQVSCATGASEGVSGSLADSGVGLGEAGDARSDREGTQQGSGDASLSDRLVDLSGHACTVNSECGAGQGCFYLIAAGCSATGTCEDLPPGPACYAETQCPGCDGGMVCLGCPGTPCAAPMGYAMAPILTDSGCN